MALPLASPNTSNAMYMQPFRDLGLGLGLQGLYSTTNCADNFLGRFTIILQNQIARVDSFTNLTKRWVFRFRLNASISSHNLISFGKQFHARGPYTANARLPKVSCLNFGTFRTRSSLDLMEYLLLLEIVRVFRNAPSHFNFSPTEFEQYRQTYNISLTISQNLNVSPLVL